MPKPRLPFALRARSRYSLRAFYITICILCGLAIISLTKDQILRYKHGLQYGDIQRRAAAQLDPTRLLKRDLECRLVHHAENKCEFIKLNCPDEEAGLFSYLSLYYCILPNAQPVAFVILVLWLGLLFTTIGITASDFFSINLSTISTLLGMSQSLAGVTFLAFGNGSPDVFSTFAAMSTHSGSLAVGELIGAAGFITAVVAGSMALVREFKVGKKTFVRDVGFFIVAASFSMFFLADGSLHLWECCVMIAFYIFYVIVVVTWHWYLTRRRRMRESKANSHGNFIAAGTEEIEVQEEDGDNEDAHNDERRPLRSPDNFDTLELGLSSRSEDGSYDSDDSDGDGDQGRLLAAEMSKSMRVVQPRGSRRNTFLNPIRPSLVGALEFRSALSTLQKSRNTETRPIHLRRYSDDSRIPEQLVMVPETIVSDYGDSIVVTDTDAIGDNAEPNSSVNRVRAVSMNDASSVRHLNAAGFSISNVPEVGVDTTSLSPKPHLNAPTWGPPPGPPSLGGLPQSSMDITPPSPSFSVSPPISDIGPLDHSHMSSVESKKVDNRLAPPGTDFPDARQLRSDILQVPAILATVSPSESSRSRSPRRPEMVIPQSRDSSRGTFSTPSSPFPIYTDSPRPISAHSTDVPSLMLPELLIPEASFVHEGNEDGPNPISWWPYRFLPCPRVMAAILFPTLCNWRDKSIWDKFLSAITAPSIFLLAITLPVVETESKEDNDESQRRRSRSYTTSGLVPVSPSGVRQEEPEWLQYRRSTLDYGASTIRSPALRGMAGHGSSATVAVSTEDLHRHPHPNSIPLKHGGSRSSNDSHTDTASSASGDWNRWLVTVQIFAAPWFVMVIIWANSSEDSLDLNFLLHLILYSGLGSLIVFVILMLTTTSEKAPRYRPMLCFLGFVVSIAWISTIANEVVGVLKAFGVILGISDAILGLTVFAVGNSLGDLVADITVARLGYPVMALSACFGGPMLNILLGIGVSGVYMTIKEADNKHAKHPGRPMKYKPYEIDVSGTLLVSAIVLLITLVGLLIVVPLNKWMFTRKIGWSLIALWTVGTVVNLIVEVTDVI